MTDPAPLLPALPALFDGFRLEIDPARERADIILDRPPLNVVTMAEREELRAVFEALDADSRVRVIVVRAAGQHFSSGGEIAGFVEASPEHVSRLAWNIAAPVRCRKPVIAASRGYCFGVGFELALACDFRLVSDTCLYALPEQRLGQIPGSGGAARLQKMVGITRTKDIVMRSRRIPGGQAHQWGIATECVADADLEPTTDRLVEELRGFAPLAQRTAKKLLNDLEDASLSLGIEIEGQCYSRLRSTDDFREGVAAFNEKRKPNFRGSDATSLAAPVDDRVEDDQEHDRADHRDEHAPQVEPGDASAAGAGEEDAADKGPYDAEYDVKQAAGALPVEQLAGAPAGNQAENDPAKNRHAATAV